MSDCGCDTPGWDPSTSGVGDHKFLIDGTDTTPAFAAAKLVAGAGIALTVLSPGGNEQLQIATTAVAAAPLTKCVYVDRGYGAASPNGSINAPFATLQAGINAILLDVNGGTVLVAPSNGSYGNVTFTLNNQNLKIEGLTDSDSQQQVIVGNITFQGTGVGTKVLELNKISAGILTDVSAAITVNLVLHDTGYSSLVGSDFTSLHITNSDPHNPTGNTVTPVSGQISAVLMAVIFNGLCTQGVAVTDGGFAYNTTFQVFPTCSINTWDLYNSNPG
jgi:hypothetical protein